MLSRSARTGLLRGAPLRGLASLSVPHRGQNFINNEWRDAEGGRTFAVSNPATEEELFQCARASTADVDAAVRNSRECFFGPSWGKQSSGRDRGDILRRMAAALKEQKEEFAILESMDNGKPVVEARADMDVCISLFDYYAGFADTFDEHRTTPVKTADTDFDVRLVQEPAGVVGLVTPWNFPLMLLAWKVSWGSPATILASYHLKNFQSTRKKT